MGQYLQAHSGHRPVKVDGELINTLEEVVDCWYEHFKNLLNIQGICDEEAVAAVPALPPLLQYDKPPTLEELEVACLKLKPGRQVICLGFCQS